MNGYPTDFGMTECIKLCASPKYSDKRVAYLGLMILVDETEDILTLMTNCLQKDLHSDDRQIVSLALNVLGDIANVEMVRDLLPEIENHLKSHDYFIRKKAVLTAVRAVRKLTPDETMGILEMIPIIFDGKDSALHITGAALISALCEQSSQNAERLQEPMTYVVIDILRNHLLTKKEQTASGSRSDTVIGSVRNPFLQAKLLTTLRQLQGTSKPGIFINDISDLLAQVASNIDGSKVAGCAVLYECVRTIVALPTGQDLRALAVNILGKFLVHKESTVRFIALQELTQVVNLDGSGILQNIENFKEKIIAGLHEVDPTVRKRAVELIYQITNGSNIEEMTKELLDYIQNSTSADAIEDACWKIFLLMDKYGPSDEFKVQTFIKALSSADDSMPEELITLFIAMVSSNQHVQPIAVLSLYKEISSSVIPVQQNGNADVFDGNQTSNENGNNSTVKRERKPRLERVTLYIIGEYGQYTESVGLGVAQVLDLFEQSLTAADAKEEKWMSPKVASRAAEDRILGEVALTGLVKFYCRACFGSNETSTNANDLFLLEQGNGDNSSALSSILALPAPPGQPEKESTGLGTDLLAIMGVEELGGKPEKALVPVSTTLTEVGTGQTNSLIALDENVSGQEGMNPIAIRVVRMLSARVGSQETEIQQRACEYLTMLNEAPHMLASVLSPMPRFDVKSIQEKARQHQNLTTNIKPSNGNSNGNLLLLDMMDEPTEGSMYAQPALPMMDDLLALPSTEPKQMQHDHEISNLNSANPLDSIFNSKVDDASQQLDNLALGFNREEQNAVSVPVKETEEAASDAPIHTTVLFDSDGLYIEAKFFKDNNSSPEETRTEMLFTNSSDVEITGFAFLLAVPKYIKLQMHPASAGDMIPGGQITQTIGLKNELHKEKPVLLRFRATYSTTMSDEVIQHQGTVGGLEML